MQKYLVYSWECLNTSLTSRTVTEVGIVKQNLPWKQLVEKFPYLEIIGENNIDFGPPKLMIGQSNAHLLKCQTTIQPSEDQPCVSKTVLGWLAHGPTGYDITEDSETNFSCHEISNEELRNLVKKNFQSEDCCSQINKVRKTEEDNGAEQIVAKTIEHKDGKYFIGSPWKNDAEFPKKFPLAVRRLGLIEKKLKKDSNLAKAHETEVKKRLEKGHAEKVYMEDFCALNPNKPGEVRMVFNCEAKVDGKSLNDFLLPFDATCFFFISRSVKNYNADKTVAEGSRTLKTNKKDFIPMLEQLAAVLAVRLYKLRSKLKKVVFSCKYCRKKKVPDKVASLVDMNWLMERIS